MRHLSQIGPVIVKSSHAPKESGALVVYSYSPPIIDYESPPVVDPVTGEEYRDIQELRINVHPKAHWGTSVINAVRKVSKTAAGCPECIIFSKECSAGDRRSPGH